MESCDHQIWNLVEKCSLMISIWPIGATYPIGQCIESYNYYIEYPTNPNIFHYINIYTGTYHYISHHNSPHPGIAVNIAMSHVSLPGNIMMWLHRLVVCVTIKGIHSQRKRREGRKETYCLLRLVVLCISSIMILFISFAVENYNASSWD